MSRHAMVSVLNNKSFCNHPVSVSLPLVTGRLINMKGGTDNKAGNSKAASAPRPQQLCEKPILASKELAVLTRGKNKESTGCFLHVM